MKKTSFLSKSVLLSLLCLGLGSMYLKANNDLNRTVVPTVTEISPNVGSPSGGTNVQISGNELHGIKSVQFGNTPALTFARYTDNIISARSPAGTGRVAITVTTEAGGTSKASAASEFEYKESNHD